MLVAAVMVEGLLYEGPLDENTEVSLRGRLVLTLFGSHGVQIAPIGTEGLMEEQRAFLRRELPYDVRLCTNLPETFDFFVDASFQPTDLARLEAKVREARCP